MRKIIILQLCFIQSCCFAQNGIVYYKQPDHSSASISINKAALKEDMAFWLSVMEESHVNLYHFISREKLKNLQDSVLNSLPDGITHQQALFAMGTLAGSLNEGHIYLPSSPMVDSLYANHSVRLPFSISNISDGRFIVASDWSKQQQLEKGDTIISISGVTSKELYNRYSKFFGGLDAWKEQLVGAYIRKLLFIDGFNSPYSIKAIRSNNDTVSFTADGLNKSQVDSLNKVLAGQQSVRTSPYTFGILDANIAHIQFNSMDGSEAFGQFLDSSFAIIKEKNCIGLIVDLRKNGGGDSKLGEQLINYISSKPYRMSGGMKWKVSSHYKAFLDMVKADQQFYRQKANGEMFEAENPATRKPSNNQYTFKGKVAVLIGANTFSSANMLADAIKEYQLATLFGEPTGECGNDFGEVFSFMLPNTHIIARASSKMFIRASGNESDFSPTRPDVEVKNTMQDNKRKKDSVLETAVNWLLTK